MFRTPLRGAVAALIMGLATTAAFAQTTPKPGEQAGCTTANGVASGAGCQQQDNGSAAGGVENGMPATQHQQEVLKTDDKAAQGGNMEATGAGAEMPATKHQQEVLTKKPGAESDDAQKPTP